MEQKEYSQLIYHFCDENFGDSIEGLIGILPKKCFLSLRSELCQRLDIDCPKYTRKYNKDDTEVGDFQTFLVRQNVRWFEEGKSVDFILDNLILELDEMSER
jgi:hypothetical protein